MRISALTFHGTAAPAVQKQSFAGYRAAFKGNCAIDDFNCTLSPAQYYLNNLSDALSYGNFSTDKILNTFEQVKNLPPKGKQEFINLYCRETGFPDMKKTSRLIEENVKYALDKAQENTGAEVLLAGYNPTCSAAIGYALPGSDFDTFFICLKDDYNSGRFTEELRKNINPLLCSMIHQRTDDQPDVVIMDDILSSIDKAQSVFDTEGLDKNSEAYASILDEQIKDWTLAGRYNSDVNRFISDEDKTPLLRAGLLMEILRDGAVITDNLDDETKEKLKNSCVYKYSNMQQMRSYKNAPLKNKHLNREKILRNFKDLTEDDQLDFIFNVIKLSVKDLKSRVSEQYKPMFKDAGCGNMEDLIQPLLTNAHRQLYYKDKI